MSNPIQVVSIIREDVSTANDCPFGIKYPDNIATSVTDESKLSRKKWKERQISKLRAFLSKRK